MTFRPHFLLPAIAAMVFLGAFASAPLAHAGVAITTDVTGLSLSTTSGASSSQVQAGAGTGAFPAATNFTLEYNGADDQILSYTATAGLYEPLAYPGTITTTLVRVPNPAFTGSNANDNNVIYSRLASSSGTTYELNAPYNGDEQAVFNGNNINNGTDNLFGNTGDGKWRQ